MNCWGIQLFSKVLDPTLTTMGLSAWSINSTNGPGRAEIAHSMWGRDQVCRPGKVPVYGFEVGTSEWYVLPVQ